VKPLVTLDESGSIHHNVRSVVIEVDLPSLTKRLAEGELAESMKRRFPPETRNWMPGAYEINGARSEVFEERPGSAHRRVASAQGGADFLRRQVGKVVAW
jgi:hypothetical protein